jgi:hypothetical protein
METTRVASPASLNALSRGWKRQQELATAYELERRAEEQAQHVSR